jgi:hypothetical protein
MPNLNTDTNNNRIQLSRILEMIGIGEDMGFAQEFR